MNPYAELDVAIDADAKTIRRAFRRRAKDTHPDAGGDPAAFARAKRASVVLLDPKRRSKYDATGQIDDDAPDNALSEVMQFIVAAMNGVVAAAVQQRVETGNLDLIAEMTKQLRRHRDALSKSNAEHQHQKTYLTLALERVTVKAGKENRVAALMRGQIAQLEHAIGNGERQKKSIGEALDLLADHGFRVDRVAGYAAAAGNWFGTTATGF